MTSADRERWDRKYAARNPHAAFSPDPLLTQNAGLLDGRGLALDVACGVGQNALWLARRGYRVMAVDGSVTGLHYGREAAAAAGLSVQFIAADLDRFTLPRDAFAVVIVFRFLNRALFPDIKQALTPGGVLFYQTFNINRLRTAPQMTRSYLLEPEELAHLTADLEMIATNDTADNRNEISFVIARRPKA